MAEETTTQPTPQGSATPPTGTPATGTTTSQGATPEKKQSLEEALARIADLERHSKNKEEEAARHGKNLSAAEKELAAYKEKERQAQEAQLSELEKANKRFSEANQIIQQKDELISQLKKQLVLAETKIKASSMDFHNPEVAAKLIQENLEYDENGNPTNLEQVLKDLAKQNPFLVKAKEQAQEQTTPAQTASQQRAPMIPVNNPGRSVISPPGQLPPNRPVRLSEVYGQKR
jgi:chromosome segregation ATPase